MAELHQFRWWNHSPFIREKLIRLAAENPVTQHLALQDLAQKWLINGVALRSQVGPLI